MSPSDAIEAAELAGLTARRAGKGTSANPFDGDDPLFAVWVCGHQGLSLRALSSEEPPPRPVRGDYDSIDVHREAMTGWREAEEARALKSGQAVYDKLKAAGAQADAGHVAYVAALNADPPALTVRPDRPIVHITPEDFRDLMTWFVTRGGTRFGLQPSMEFEWFGGSVLVVVR